MASQITIRFVGTPEVPISVEKEEEDLTAVARAEGIAYARVNIAGMPLIIDAKHGAELTVFTPEGEKFRWIVVEQPAQEEKVVEEAVENSLVPFYMPRPVPPYVPPPSCMSRVRRAASAIKETGSRIGQKLYPWGCQAAKCTASAALVAAKGGVVVAKQGAIWGYRALHITGQILGDNLEIAGQTLQDAARWSRENCPAVLGAAGLALAYSQIS